MIKVCVEQKWRPILDEAFLLGGILTIVVVKMPSVRMMREERCWRISDVRRGVLEDDDESASSRAKD